MTETPPQAQDDDPQPVGGSGDDQPNPAAGLPQPPPYRGVYGQQPSTVPSSYGQPAYGVPPQGQSAYGTQPGSGGYDPRWGYGPPGNPRHPQYGQPTGDDTTMALFCYIGVLLGGFLVPLIFYFIKKDQSQFVRFHAAQALNFALTQMIMLFGVLIPVGVLAVVLRQPAILVVLAPFWLYELISQYVWMILGAIRSNRGEWYTLPKWTCFRMVR